MWSTLSKTNSEFTLKIVGTWHFLLGPDLSTPTSPTPPKTKKNTNSTTPWLPQSLQVGTQGWPKVYSLGRLLGWWHLCQSLWSRGLLVGPRAVGEPCCSEKYVFWGDKLAVGRPSKWTTYFCDIFFCLGWKVIISTKATAIAVFLEGTCQKTAVNKKMVGMAGP